MRLEQQRGNAVACIIHSLDLPNSGMTLTLPDLEAEGTSWRGSGDVFADTVSRECVQSDRGLTAVHRPAASLKQVECTFT